MKNPELRKDDISGDWILFAPGRFHRPKDLRKDAEKRVRAPKEACPFEKPFLNVDERIILEYTKRGEQVERGAESKRRDWGLLVLQNKFPAVIHSGRRPRPRSRGLFTTMPGFGHHDLVITRSHTNDFPALSRDETFHVFQAFRDRYLMLFADKNVAYVSMFHNWGRRAGATIYHPHYQMLGIPVVPPEVERSLEGSRAYARRTGACPHCAMIAWEKRAKKRVIMETNNVIAFAPFASRNAFEVRVFPKRHLAFFENTDDEALAEVATMLRKVLARVKNKLGDPDYNFFIHTAPMRDKEKHKYYHWHIEIYPSFGVRAGFEFDTGLILNTVDPDFAARTLKG